jgi:hypothetical protein
VIEEPVGFGHPSTRSRSEIFLEGTIDPGTWRSGGAQFASGGMSNLTRDVSLRARKGGSDK